MVSHRIPRSPVDELVSPRAHCECGQVAIPVICIEGYTSCARAIGYYCPDHGPLTHDALVFERKEPGCPNASSTGASTPEIPSPA